MGERKTWREFREAGLLWWINRSLHLFGWAIIVSVDEDTGDVVDVWPELVGFRGFPLANEERGYTRLTHHLHDNAGRLVAEVDAGGPTADEAMEEGRLDSPEELARGGE